MCVELIWVSPSPLVVEHTRCGPLGLTRDVQFIAVNMLFLWNRYTLACSILCWHHSVTSQYCSAFSLILCSHCTVPIWQNSRMAFHQRVWVTTSATRCKTKCPHARWMASFGQLHGTQKIGIVCLIWSFVILRKNVQRCRDGNAKKHYNNNATRQGR